LLKQGASWFVDGASGLAKKLDVSELAIGLTVVAFGTSAPELVVNSFASFKGNDEIVLGNIIGSNIFNLFVILSIAGIITPLRVKSSTAWREIPFSFFALAILFILANDSLILCRDDSTINRLDSILLLIFLILFILYVFKQLKNERKGIKEEQKEITTIKIAILVASGLTGLILGGKLVLDNAVKLATQLNVSEKIIGLTIVAAGTSLPELATSVIAAIKKSSDLAVGNIIGSNIFNILFILSVSSLIKPIRFNTSFNFDIVLLAGGTLLLYIAMYSGQRKQIDRWEALVLLASYLIYMLYLLF
jgi:cation:H+ antiporter